MIELLSASVDGENMMDGGINLNYLKTHYSKFSLRFCARLSLHLENTPVRVKITKFKHENNFSPFGEISLHKSFKALPASSFYCERLK